MIDRLRLPFQEQIDFFLQKLNIPTERWDDILGAAHDRAFVVAGAAKADLLADLRVAMDMVIKEGKTIDWFRDAFDTIVSERGWNYKGERNWRTRIIYTTNLNTSYAAGRWQQLNDPELLRLKPFWMYKHADHVLQPRPLHVAWDGTTLPANDSWFLTRFPPNGWGCHCRVTAVSEAEARRENGKFRRPDDGTYTYTDRNGQPHTLPNGVDYGWDYAPGENAQARLDQLLDPKLKRLFGPLEPLGIKHPVGSLSDIATILKELSEQQPKLLEKFVSASPDNDAGAFMSTWGDGRFYFSDPNGAEHRLKVAFAKIRQGAALDFNDEYTLKALWHEIGHNQQKYLEDILPRRLDDISRVVMETVHDTIARQTYGDFVTALGAKARYQPNIFSTNMGYGTTVNRLEALLNGVGLSSQELLPELKHINFDLRLTRIVENTAGMIIKAVKQRDGIDLPVDLVRKALKKINKATDFEPALEAVLQAYVDLLAG